MPFDRPLQRRRKPVEIVRQVLRRERVRFDGEVFQLDQGLKLLVHPLRDRVPIFLAPLTPAGVQLTGEIADGWIPTLFSPDHFDLFRPELEAGAPPAGRSLAAGELAPYAHVLADDDPSPARGAPRAWVAPSAVAVASRAA